MNTSRRDFLCRSGAVLGATAFASGVERFSLVHTLASAPVAAPSNYRALVCVFFDGGNDGNNMIVPIDTTGYAAYSAVRSASGLAIAQGQLLPVTPPSINQPFGLHPNLTQLHGLWGQNKLAIVSNVGPLIHPMTRDQYRRNLVPKPYQLFSHSDQVAQWQSAISNMRSQTGWGGRLADRLAEFNGGSAFPMVLSVAGTSLYGQGQIKRALSINPAPTALNQVLVLNGFGSSAEETARRNSMTYLRTLDLGQSLIKASSETMQQAIDISQAFSVDPVLTTVFPTTSLGNQLKQIAKVIKLNLTSAQLSLERQIFFCRIGGFDTHQDQPANQGSLMTQFDAAMKAFYDATIELGVASQVTTFTLSDFGRTLQPSGTGSSVGTDHGWGSHLFVMGGAVRGGDFYGVAGPSGTVFPTLQLSGPSDTDSRGRWIPTSAVDQYAATLATWYGLTPGDRALVFPLIGNFDAPDLGFMT